MMGGPVASRQSLVLGTLELVENENDLFSVFALGEGTTWGNPEPIEESLQSVLADGARIVTRGAGNREIVIQLEIRGPDFPAAERALFRELQKQNTLTWTPPNSFEMPCVFEVETSSLDQVPDDLALVQGRRYYAVRLVALPWVRSVSKTAIAAVEVPTTPTTATINDGSSAAGWFSNLPVSQASGEVRVTGNGGQNYGIGLRGAPVDLASTRIIVWDWQVRTTDPRYSENNVYGMIDKRRVDLLSQGPSPVAGYIRSTFQVPLALLSASEFELYYNAPNISSASQVVVAVNQILRTNEPPFSGTRRQKFRQFAVGGSAPTQVEMHVSHPTQGLGSLLVYSRPDDGLAYQPPLSQFRSAGGSPSPDTAAISGSWKSLTTTTSFDQPASNLPRGKYDLFARVRTATAGFVRIYSAAHALIGTTTKGSQSEVFESVLPMANVGVIVRLGSFALPPVEMVGLTSKIRIDIQRWAGHAFNVDVDEAWLFETEQGSLTYVECGAGAKNPAGPSSDLWIDAPTADRPWPRVLVGSLADKTDAFGPGSAAMILPGEEGHRTIPGRVNVFTASSVEDVTVSAEYYKRWHTYAAE